MGKLYIFGNGFDRHYGLKTSPSDFVEYLRNESIYNETGNAAEIFEDYNVFWSDFEQGIANIDLNQIEENQVEYPDYMSDHEYDRDGVIVNVEEYVDSLSRAIDNALMNMIRVAEEEISNLPADNQWIFDKDDIIISFNYTSTIESISSTVNSVPILHIHGFYNTGDRLILGYDEPLDKYNYEKSSNPEDIDPYVDKELRLIYSFYLSLQKPMQFDRLKLFLQHADSIDEVIVYGHSFGKIDAPYMEMIDRILNPIRWKVSCYQNNSDLLNNVNQVSFRDKIEIFSW